VHGVIDARKRSQPGVPSPEAGIEWDNLTSDSGTGKSPLLIALGDEAAMADYSVRNTLAAKIVNELARPPTTSS
jgi:hypothetical protein